MFYRAFKKIAFFTLFFYILLFIFYTKTFASDYKANYNVEYFLEHNNNSINSLVKYKISITNLNEHSYVNKFSMIFPNDFSISNIQASDDNGLIDPQITKKDNTLNIELIFSNPKKEINSENNFYLSFNQSNLFNINGNVWEVILPIIETKENENYEVVVNLPNYSNKKISISKPTPDNISQNRIYWKNPRTKTIYAVFGDYQIYKVNLKYNLKNPKYTKVYTDIAFPPDTEYQKVFLNKIDPLPNMIYLDKDNNYIGRYILNSKETKNIIYESLIKITSNSRSELNSYIKSQFNLQKKYLLNELSLWRITDIEKYKNLNNAKNINDYLVNSFSYNYSRIDQDVKRMGADFALNNPKNVVCTEFSDSFIALAREKGIYSREVQGYGYSKSLNLRPISSNSDVLHSWPQYFELQQNKWISIDPTWQNTSGIDYFSSFDLNHIVFVIHGFEANYPLPGGAYKVKDSKDIEITTLNKEPLEKININIFEINLPKRIISDKRINSSIKVQNKSNVFLYDIPIYISSDKLLINMNTNNVDVLAPFQTKEIKFSFIAKDKSIQSAKIAFQVKDSQIVARDIKIINIKFYFILFFISISTLISILFFIKKRSK